MPKHTDAIGYILDLGRSEDINWFEMICNISASGESVLTADKLDILIKLFTKHDVSYPHKLAPTTIPTGKAATLATEQLKQLGPFVGFKRLSDSLTITFSKKVTVVFGTNGSGKSSLCEALQILASQDVPPRPFNDVLSTEEVFPSFSYRFKSDSSSQTWISSSNSYGTRASTLKYFNNAIAIHNVQSSVQPGRVIELSPFKLHVFEIAKNHCTSLKTELKKLEEKNNSQLSNVLARIREKFEDFRDSRLAKITESYADILECEIKVGRNYSDDTTLESKLRRKTELNKATSDEGIKSLKGEVVTLKALLAEIESIARACEKLIEIDPLS